MVARTASVMRRDRVAIGGGTRSDISAIRSSAIGPGPLGMADTRFRPPPELRERIAPTEEDPWRGRLVRGEVHDENAFALGGVAPHAGLFSTAGDLVRWAALLMAAAPTAEPVTLTSATCPAMVCSKDNCR